MNIDINKIAKLSKLKIDADDETKYVAAILDILDKVDKIPKFEFSLSLLYPKNPMDLREDKVIKTTNQDEILSNATETFCGCVLVPRTIE